MRLIFSIVTILLISATVFAVGWVAERNARTSLAAEIENRLILEARNLAFLSDDALLSDYPELTLIPVVSEMTRSRPDLSIVAVLDHDGLVKGHMEARMLGEPLAELADMPEVSRPDLDEGERFFMNDELILVTVPARSPIERELLGTAVVGLYRSYIDTIIMRARRDLILITAVLLVAGILSSFITISFLLRPVNALRAGLTRIGAGDLDTPIALKDRTELGLLADTVDEMAAALKVSREESNAKEQEIIDTQKEIIHTLGTIVECRSKETANHIVRVGLCARLLGRLAGLDEEEADLVYLSSPMHDVGKVAIPDHVLNKPGRLTPEEFDLIKTHANIGYELLKNSDRPILRAAATIAHQHHEKWDGSGYPRGLVGEQIHLYGRIVAIVDVFDALMSHRAYKSAMTPKEIHDIFMADRGKHFDPNLTDLFLGHFHQFLTIHRTHADPPRVEIPRAA